jgi:hypothetical protein
MKESGVGVLKIEELELEVLRTDSTALMCEWIKQVNEVPGLFICANRWQ